MDSVFLLLSCATRRFLRTSRYVMRRRQWHPTPVLLPGKSHGRRSLIGYSPWGREESDTTKHLHFHFSLSCIGEGNGIPLQCSCLESPRDGRAWWAADYGSAQSQTRLKRLSSSSSRYVVMKPWRRKLSQRGRWRSMLVREGWCDGPLSSCREFRS